MSIRKDKYVVYSNDDIKFEAFALNDTSRETGGVITVSVYFGNALQATYKKSGSVKPFSSTYFGDVIVKPNGYTGKITVVSKMTADGNDTYFELSVYAVSENAKAKKTPVVYGEKLVDVKKLCCGSLEKNVVICDDIEYRNRQDELEAQVLNGARVVVFTDKPIRIFDEDIIFKIHNVAEELTTCRMAWHSQTDPIVCEFAPMAFNNVYNAECDYQDLLAWFHFDWQGSRELLYMLEDDNPDEHCMTKKHVMIMAAKKYGKGEVVLSTISALKGCIGHNPYLDKLFVNLIEK